MDSLEKKKFISYKHFQEKKKIKIEMLNPKSPWVYFRVSMITIDL